MSQVFQLFRDWEGRRIRVAGGGGEETGKPEDCQKQVAYDKFVLEPEMMLFMTVRTVLMERQGGGQTHCKAGVHL